MMKLCSEIFIDKVFVLSKQIIPLKFQKQLEELSIECFLEWNFDGWLIYSFVWKGIVWTDVIDYNVMNAFWCAFSSRRLIPRLRASTTKQFSLRTKEKCHGKQFTEIRLQIATQPLTNSYTIHCEFETKSLWNFLITKILLSCFNSMTSII